MCGCKDCKEITLLSGTDGRGIVSITANGDGTFTYLFTDGTIYVSPNLTGPEGADGAPGIQGIPGPQGDPGVNGNWSVIEYITDPIGADTSGTEPTFIGLSPFSYTVPLLAPASADYEITFHASIAMETFTETLRHGVFVDIYKNLAQIDSACVKGVRACTASYLPIAFNVTTSIIVTLVPGDQIDIFSTSDAPSDAYLIGGIFKVVKLG